MNKYKRFTLILLFSLIGFVSFHGIIWQFTKMVYPNNYIVGDLARMSYKFDLITHRENKNTLTKKHIHFNDYEGEEVDVVTIGDSFSNGGGGGQNRYYQDYISSMYDLRVLNIPDISNTNNYIDTIMILLNSDFFERVKTKYIILECVQRNTYLNLGFNELNLDLIYKDDIFNRIIKSKDIFNNKESKNKMTFINNLNYNLLKYNLNFYRNGYGKFRNYYIEKLDKNLFSSKVKDELVFFYDDINLLNQENKENLNLLNKKLNLIAKKLKEKEIKLYYMPAVDKYNLYRDNLLSKDKYPKSIFFEYIETLQKDYYFINTKKILLEELNNNVQDLYYSDDTHWSNKASEAIISKLNFN